jgi:DNA-binding transcriptional MocR family regulator
MISFAGEGLSPELLPVEELTDCAATALGADGKRILSYGTGAGYTPLREAIAERFEVHPHRVLITNGWLQGFELLAEAHAAGGVAVVEFPGYDRALRLLLALGTTLLYADWHDDGIALDTLSEHVRMSQIPPTFSLWSPTFHNPTGLTLTHEQRWDIGRLMLQSGITMVEDDTYGPLRFEGEPVPTMFRVFGQRPIYSASLSATVAPGLRVGVWIVPDELSNELATRANDRYISPALLGQATVFEFMVRSRYDSHVEFVAARLLERRDLLIAALQKHLPDATWTRPEGGIFLLLRLPPGTDAGAVLAAAEGVEATPGVEFMGLPNSIRLNYGAPALAEIEEGVERLARAAERLRG